jgi:transposase
MLLLGMNNKGQLPRQGRGVRAEIFRFSGQSKLETWSLKEYFQTHGWSGYDRWLSHEPVLCFQRIRELVEAFPTWQRRAQTGRPAIDERTHLVAALVRQFLDATYRELEAYLKILQDFFGISHPPDANTLSEKNRSRRFLKLFHRFHQWILSKLPRRRSIIATDATGYSNEKKPWSRTGYGLRATQNWIKVHAAVEIPSLLYLSTINTQGGVHESRVFHEVWANLPANVQPIRSLADAAYSGGPCLETARAHGATPLHTLRKDASPTRQGEGPYSRLVQWAHQFPNRYQQLTGKRSLVETAFQATKQKLGDRLRCRHPIARANEVQAKQTAHNIRMILMREQLTQP